MDALGDFELFLDGEEIFFAGKNAVSYEIAETADENEEADWLEIPARDDSQADEVGVEDEDSKDGKAPGNDPEVARKSARGTIEEQKNGENQPENEDEDTVGDIDFAASDMEKFGGDGNGGEQNLHQENDAKNPSAPRVDILKKDEKRWNDDGEGDHSLDVSRESARKVEGDEEGAFASEHAHGIENNEDAEIEEARVGRAAAEQENSESGKADSEKDGGDAESKESPAPAIRRERGYLEEGGEWDERRHWKMFYTG